MAKDRQLISSGAPWENIVGYSRAVRVGDLIFVAGTTAMDGNEVVGMGSVYEQTRFILQKIGKALEEAGASLNDVVRTRIFVTQIRQWEEAGRAHGEFFREVRPAATLVEVKALVRPELLVEIEADAVIGSGKIF